MSPGGAEAISPQRKPWVSGRSGNSPRGAEENNLAYPFLTPLPGLSRRSDSYPRLTPWANWLRPYGAHK
jgi:hypothetical protein